MAINEVTHVDGNRVSRNEGSIRLTELRTRLGRGECDSGGHRLCAMSKGEAEDVRVLLQDKIIGLVAHALLCHVLLVAGCSSSFGLVL